MWVLGLVIMIDQIDQNVLRGVIPQLKADFNIDNTQPPPVPLKGGLVHEIENAVCVLLVPLEPRRRGLDRWAHSQRSVDRRTGGYCPDPDVAPHRVRPDALRDR